MHGTTLVSLIGNVELPTGTNAQPQKRQLSPNVMGFHHFPLAAD
ncbi:hypothetical protein [Limosilactobacillus urinaemulieris]|nr:hypothetical protein [Limosilactobacillus urinaemulieris]